MGAPAPWKASAHDGLLLHVLLRPLESITHTLSLSRLMSLERDVGLYSKDRDATQTGGVKEAKGERERGGFC